MMRITARGQVTIPQDIRERAGLMPGTDVQFHIADGAVLITKTRGPRQTRGQKLLAHLRGKGGFPASADEIVAMMRGPAADEDAPPKR